MKKIQTRLNKLSKRQLQEICKRMKIKCPKRKRYIVNKLLQPLETKYKMFSACMRDDTCEDEHEHTLKINQAKERMENIKRGLENKLKEYNDLKQKRESKASKKYMKSLNDLITNLEERKVEVDNFISRIDATHIAHSALERSKRMSRP